MRSIVVLVSLLAVRLSAQNISATLLGNVTDSSGAGVPFASIEAKARDTGVIARAHSDRLGGYQIPYLRPGVYSLSVTAAGFRAMHREHLELRVDSRVRIDFHLELGELSSSITVTGDAPLLESQTAALGQVIGERSIRDLPIRGRNVFDLAALSPAVQVNPRRTEGGVGAYASFVMSDLSINGSRYRTNEYMVDGVSVMLPENNNFAFAPTPEGTQEFKVQTNSYGAQFGRSGGGVINVVTRGGSKDFHGSVFEYFRNDRLSANSFFANARNQARGLYHFNLFGAHAGGPVRRNRTFFFGEYQGHRQSSFGGAGVTTVPTGPQRSGDFSGLRNATNDPVILFDPFTTRANPSGPGFVRSAYPGNRIPQAQFDRVAANLIRFLPLPNRPGEGPAELRNFGFAPSSFVRSDQLSVRIDHRFSERHNLFGRFTRSFASDGSTGPFKTIAENLTGRQQNHVHNAVLNSTHVLRANRILNWRYGLTRRFEARVPLADGQVNLTELGFSSTVAAAAQEAAFPTVGLGTYAQLGPPTGDRIRRGNDIHTVVAEQTDIRGRHTLVYGADLRLYNQTPFQGGAPAGSYSFGRGQTQGPDPQRATLTAGNEFASFLTGFGTGSITSVPAFAVRNYYAALFANDEIKATKRLTINVGLRYDYEQPRTERYDRFANFDWDRTSSLGGVSVRGLLTFAGIDNDSRGQFQPAYRNFGPRVGLAYRVTERLVARAGYGIYYAPRIGSTNANSLGASGAELATSWVSSLDGVTPLTLLSNPYPGGLLLPPENEAERRLLGQSLNITDRDNRSNNYTQQWNFSLQKQVGGQWLLEAAYSGSRGIRNTIRWNWNQLDPKFQALGSDLNRQVANPFFGSVRTGQLANRTVPQSALLRPYPQYTGLSTNWQNRSASTYHSLQMKAERRFSRGFQVLVSYTAGKLIDDSSGRVIDYTDFTPPVQDYWNLRAERSLSTGDVSRRLVIAHTWDLPFRALFPRAWIRLTSGWSVSGNASFFTGFPLALTSSGNSGVGGGVIRPNSAGRTAKLAGSPQSRLQRYFDVSAFTIPEPFTFGNASRTLPDVRGPGRGNYDVTLLKNTRVTEKMGVEFRLEAYNLTNTPFFLPPATGLGSNNFGIITGSLGARQLQASLRLLW